MDTVKRKNIRLSQYDYSQPGGYYITVCSQDRKCIFSSIQQSTEIERSGVILTELGEIAENVLRTLPDQYGFLLDAYVIMPNHIHMVLIKEKNIEEKQKTVGQFVGAFKSLVTNYWCKICNARGITAGKLWQRNYYGHILRNQADHLEKIKYIDENPDKWAGDELYME